MEQSSNAMEGLGMVEPKDARFTFSDGQPTVVPSVDGMGVAKEDLARAVGEAMVKATERTSSVSVAPREAEFTTAEAEALGIKEVTGEFTTKFPATAYRVNNIGKSAGLINAYLVHGCTLTSYHTIQLDLENAGASWVDQEVVVDGNLVTSRQPSYIPAFNREMLRVFTASRQGGEQYGLPVHEQAPTA